MTGMAALRRPSMKGRDSSGREISLLNSSQPAETASVSQPQPPQFRMPSYSTQYASDAPHMARSNSNLSSQSNSSVPSLLRSESYDSQGTNESRSPITPTFPSSHGRNHSFSVQYGKEYAYFDHREMRTSLDEYSSRSIPSISQKAIQSIAMQQYSDEHIYQDDPYSGHSERSTTGKRYPCRFKDSHNCDKTFTTSGHASRHSKIHTAEKAVPCSFAGCTKKFTRADNMKQHLDTHYKDKPRSSTSSSSGAGKPSGKSPLTMPAGVQKKSSPPIGTRSPKLCTPLRTGSSSRSEIPPFDINANVQYPVSNRRYSLTASPISSYGALDMAAFGQNLPSRSRGQNGSGSLDLLVEAALN
ncbi:C2H2 transcription factor protein [Rutstroemia sp. NJR-2017a WRK4]|nr:C2H2 transcription factor protein [Rutstroemia sp. NJR-2017a WRK4]